MANSNSKAISLKDAYIKGVQDVAGPEATAAAGQAELQALGGKLGMDQGEVASITMDPLGNRRNFIDDGDPSVYVLNERGDKKRQTMNASEGEAIGMPSEFMANPIKYNGEQGYSDFPNADDRRMPAGIRGREYTNLQKGRLQGRPVRDADMEDLRMHNGSEAFNTSNLQGKLGMEQGDTAGVWFDLDNRETFDINDGRDTVLYTGGGRQYEMSHPDARWPIRNGGRGDARTYPMGPASVQNGWNILFRNSR